MAKADEFKERLWDHTRHLGQGNGPAGTVHQVEYDPGTGELTVTMNEEEDCVRTYSLDATAGRKRRAPDAA